MVTRRKRSTTARAVWSRSTLLVVACGALVLGACSTSDDDGGAAASGETPSSTTTDPARVDQPLDRYVGYESAVYADPANWLCRPEVDDICDDGLDATSVAADGTVADEPWRADEDAPIDCFYVYPTISRDPTEYSDLQASDDEEGFAALNQVARLGHECRVFAPVYRQRTLAGLTAALADRAPTAQGTATTTTTTVAAQDGAPPQDPAFADVLDAWQQYMANDNDGRGVVLIGHSQGAGMLAKLLSSEFDPNPEVRDRLVAAYLAGTSVGVPEGADVGGDFAEIPLCRAADQTGCIVTWSSFRSAEPPPADAFFGRPRGSGLVAGCTSPASLAGGSAEATSYFPAAPGSSILAALGTGTGSGTSWVDPSKGEVTTPFVTTPGLVTVECATHDGFNYLAVTVHGDPADPRVDDIGGDLTPQWGLHLQDVNLVMGDIVELVHQQRAAYAAQGG